MTKTFTKEEIINILEEEYPIHSEIVYQRRWETIYREVYKIDDKHYVINVSRGSTEMQETDYEYQKLEFKEVELKEVMVKKWVPVQ